MGEPTQFREGQKAPKNGIYMEIGETGTSVSDPQILKMQTGDKFPETSNQNRVWTYEKN